MQYGSKQQAFIAFDNDKEQSQHVGDFYERMEKYPFLIFFSLLDFVLLHARHSKYKRNSPIIPTGLRSIFIPKRKILILFLHNSTLAYVNERS